MRKLTAGLIGLAILAPAALAASPSLKVSPSSPTAGKKVTASGTAPSNCKHTVVIYSKAFKSSTKFSGTPSVNATISHHQYSAKATISTMSDGSYKVTARCKGQAFSHVSVNVVGFYP
jgi:hypothetical protein